MSLFTSILTAGSNSHQETSENANALATDFVTQGVIGAIANTSGVAPATGPYAVNAQGSPNMTVAVSSGAAYATATPASQNSQALRVRNTASANVTIAANASGSTKFDWIYISVDATKAANPASDASDVATLVVSRSSSSSTDNGTPPTYGLNIAVVTVANGASSITNGNIADKRVLATNAPAGSVGYGALSNDSSWGWTDYSSTSTITGWSAFTDKVIRYKQVGKTVFLNFNLGGTSNSTSITFTVPIAAKNQGSGLTSEMATGLAENNGAVDSSPGRVYIDASANASLVNVTRQGGASSWTASGLKLARGLYIYEAA